MTSYDAGLAADGRFGKLRGEADYTSALNSTIAAMSTGDVLDLGGGTVRHDDIINVFNRHDITIRNGTLVATTPASSAMIIDNTVSNPTNRITVQNVNFRLDPRSAITAANIPGNGSEGMLISGGDGHVIKGCTFDGFQQSGMRVVDATSNFRLINNTFRFNRAASCWIGGGSFGGVVKGLRSYGGGDDGFCIDGLAGPRCHDIVVTDLYHDGILPTSSSDTAGPIRPATRGFSLLSCYNVVVDGFEIRNSAAAAFSVTVDSGDVGSPLPIDNVTIKNGDIYGAAWRNSSSLTDTVVAHPAILVFSNVSGVAVDDVRIEDVTVHSMHSSAPNWRDMRTFNGGVVTNLMFDRVTGPTGKSTVSNITQNTHYFDRKVALA
jgi:hypothetical protein